MQATTTLPTSTKSLKSWLSNFSENVSELASELNINEGKVSFMCDRLKGVIIDLQKKELGMQHDRVVANLNRRKTLEDLEVFIDHIKRRPGFDQEVHGEKLGLEM